MEKENNIVKMIDEVIREEKEIVPNAFLSTRVMASVDASSHDEYIQLLPVWKTALLSLGFFAAVFGGIAAGSLYKSPNKQPGIVLTSDDKMETFGFFQQMENE